MRIQEVITGDGPAMWTQASCLTVVLIIFFGWALFRMQLERERNRDLPAEK